MVGDHLYVGSGKKDSKDGPRIFTLERAPCKGLIKAKGKWEILTIKLSGACDQVFTPISSHEILVMGGDFVRDDIFIIDTKTNSFAKVGKTPTTTSPILCLNNQTVMK